MGNAEGRRRRFGSVRQLRSGQWQARYQGPDWIMRPADQTFRTKAEAERWLTRTEADILDGDWMDPAADWSLSGSTRPPGSPSVPISGPRPSGFTSTCCDVISHHSWEAGLWPRSRSPMCATGARVFSTQAPAP